MLTTVNYLFSMNNCSVKASKNYWKSYKFALTTFGNSNTDTVEKVKIKYDKFFSGFI